MPRNRAARPTGWRIGVPVATLIAGLLLATSYVGADGADLRAGERRTDLADLVVSSGASVETVRIRAARLQRQVDALADDAAGDAVTPAEAARATRLRDRVGLSPVAGPGLTVVLDDAPESAIDAAGQRAEVGLAADLDSGEPEAQPDVTVSDLVVHQQDIQAVVNALWEGGAEAMTIRGQRVVATTGIKCVGNSVILHGVPYSPPYDIAAVGDPALLRAALERSAYVASYRDVADAYGLGFVVLAEGELRMPAYTGTTALRHARPLTG